MPDREIKKRISHISNPNNPSQENKIPELYKRRIMDLVSKIQKNNLDLHFQSISDITLDKLIRFKLFLRPTINKATELLKTYNYQDNLDPVLNFLTPTQASPTDGAGSSEYKFIYA